MGTVQITSHDATDDADGSDDAGDTDAETDAAPAPARPPARRPGRPRALPLDEQRRLIVDAGRVVFAQEGYAGATIERVARQAGTARSSVYELFHGKEELFAAVVADSAERFVAALNTRLHEASALELRDYVRNSYAATFDLFERDRHSVTVLLNAERGGLEPPMQAVAETRRRVLTELAASTRERWAQYGIEVGGVSEVLSLIFFGVGEAVAVRQAGNPRWDREALIDLLTEFTLGGLYRLGRHADVIAAAEPRAER
jgi:AcrR family transcriptional regulator